MAKKGGFGRFLGGLAGRPYDRLLNRLEKITKAHSGNELIMELERFVKIVQRTHDEDQIDDEEHDLLIEEIEDVHPEGKTFIRRGDDEEEFYDGEGLPDAPELQLGSRQDLDELMRARDGSFTGSFGRDEYEEYRQQMAEDFFKESDEALAAGDHQTMTSQEPGHRVFHDVEDEATDLKRKIAEEMGVEIEEEPTNSEDETYRVDEDGTEWWQDDEGQWWYRPQNEEDWFPYDE
ncbi:MAG: hypothetical protein QF440_00275 [Candidatus Thalassarchaeaceae archaeon]|jgi:hypothetical protein|nr:hypothetical protein [Candidatus Thalassarchaeaceae archaeon]